MIEWKGRNRDPGAMLNIFIHKFTEILLVTNRP